MIDLIMKCTVTWIALIGIVLTIGAPIFLFIKFSSFTPLLMYIIFLPMTIMLIIAIKLLWEY